MHRAVTTRDAKFANFVEVDFRNYPPFKLLTLSSLQYRTHKLIYRRYAGLFFTLCVDVNDTELVQPLAVLYLSSTLLQLMPRVGLLGGHSSFCRDSRSVSLPPPFHHPCPSLPKPYQLPSGNTCCRYFGNVCELDLVFNFNKVRRICIRMSQTRSPKRRCSRLRVA